MSSDPPAPPSTKPNSFKLKLFGFGWALSVGIISIGGNAVGSFIAIGGNAAAPIAIGAINSVGIISFAGVNAIGLYGGAGVNTLAFTDARVGMLGAVLYAVPWLVRYVWIYVTERHMQKLVDKEPAPIPLTALTAEYEGWVRATVSHRPGDAQVLLKEGSTELLLSAVDPDQLLLGYHAKEDDMLAFLRVVSSAAEVPDDYRVSARRTTHEVFRVRPVPAKEPMSDHARASLVQGVGGLVIAALLGVARGYGVL